MSPRIPATLLVAFLIVLLNATLTSLPSPTKTITHTQKKEGIDRRVGQSATKLQPILRTQNGGYTINVDGLLLTFFYNESIHDVAAKLHEVSMNE